MPKSAFRMRDAARFHRSDLGFLALAVATLGGGATAAAQDGWREWDAGGVTLLAPPRLRAPGVDSQTPSRVDPRAPEWTFTLTDSPGRPDRGVTLTFMWSRDVTEAPTGDDVMSDRALRLGGRDARKFSWRTPSMGWRGFDVIIGGVAESGERFRFTCHAPEFRWREARSLCDRVAETIRFPSGPAPIAAPSEPGAAQGHLEIARERLSLFMKNQSIADWRAGYEAAKKSVAVAPRGAENWRVFGYANSLAPQDRERYLPQAELAYRKAIELDSRNASARLLLASLLISNAQLAPAIEQIEAALDAKPGLATSKVIGDLTRLYQRAGDKERGVAFYAGFSARHPDASAVLLGQATLLKESGRTPEALLLLQKLATDATTAPQDAEQARALLNAWL